MNVNQRQAIEKQIANRVIKDFLAAGFVISVNDGEEITLAHCDKPRKIAGAMFTTDEDYLIIHAKDGESFKRKGWVRFIYGNDGWDVVSDYSTSLEEWMAPINNWSDKFCK